MFLAADLVDHVPDLFGWRLRVELRKVSLPGVAFALFNGFLRLCTGFSVALQVCLGVAFGKVPKGRFAFFDGRPALFSEPWPVHTCLGVELDFGIASSAISFSLLVSSSISSLAFSNLVLLMLSLHKV